MTPQLIFFFRKLSPAPLSSGTNFKGYSTVGALTFMRAFSISEAPEQKNSMKPLLRPRRGR